MKASVHIGGIGILGPGLSGWPEAAKVLRGEHGYMPSATLLPLPGLLPAAERRRTGRVVKLALALAAEASSAAGIDPAQLASVFTSSGGDGYVCHENCEALTEIPRELSPTRFSNSVHNAPAGYWSIATGAQTEANVLCAYDASFAAGLLEAVSQTIVDQTPTLLVAYDTEYPAPLHSKRPLPDAFGIAMVFTPHPMANSLAELEAVFSQEEFETMADAGLESLRASLPAARGLPLLNLLARRAAGRCVLEYLDVSRIAVRVAPCR